MSKGRHQSTRRLLESTWANPDTLRETEERMSSRLTSRFTCRRASLPAVARSSAGERQRQTVTEVRGSV